MREHVHHHPPLQVQAAQQGHQVGHQRLLQHQQWRLACLLGHLLLFRSRVVVVAVVVLLLIIFVSALVVVHDMAVGMSGGLVDGLFTPEADAFVVALHRVDRIQLEHVLVEVPPAHPTALDERGCGSFPVVAVAVHYPSLYPPILHRRHRLQHVLDEMIRGLAVLEEGMAEKLVGRRPLGGVSAEAGGHHVLKRLGELLLLAAAAGAVSAVLLEAQPVGNLHHERLGQGEVGQRRAAMGELERRDAERPDVGLDAVPRVGVDHLGCHPVGRAGHVVEEGGGGGGHVEGDGGGGVRLVDGGGDTEVGELDGAVGVDEDVAGLDVAVDVALAVQVGESVENLPQDDSDGRLGEAVGEGGGDDGLQRAGGHEGHHHPEVAVDREGAVGAEDVGVGKQRHSLRLPPHVVQVGPRPLQIDRLDGHHRAVHRQARRLVHHRAHAAAHLVQQPVALGIQRIHDARLLLLTMSTSNQVFWLYKDHKAM